LTLSGRAVFQPYPHSTISNYKHAAALSGYDIAYQITLGHQHGRSDGISVGDDPATQRGFFVVAAVAQGRASGGYTHAGDCVCVRLA